MRDLLSRLDIPSFDGAGYISDHSNNVTALPNIGLAMSGGGYRALLNGAGAIQAFDNREQNGTLEKHLGGLLQASTYLAGLSGGSWLVGSIFVNNFTTITSLLNNQNSSSLWEFDNSILEGPDQGGLQILDTADYFSTLEKEVNGKQDANFNIRYASPAGKKFYHLDKPNFLRSAVYLLTRYLNSLTDYWGRGLSFQLINATDGGPAYTWSSISQQDSFTQGNTPFPIVIADGRNPGETLIPINTTIYEFNPFEMGSWDPTIYGFVPIEVLGSNLSGGRLASPEQCGRGFDNAGYIMGTSSSLFNQLELNVGSSNAIPDAAKGFVTDVLNKLSGKDNDIATYEPNPFYGYSNSTSAIAQSNTLDLVDGGEDLENLPLHPLTQPVRHVDVIFAVDSSADVNNWPNGTALVATYERSLNQTGIGNGTAFPSIPDVNTFVNLGLNTRPTFFGCNSSNTSSPTPLVVYIPNYPYVYQSNVSTLTLSYNNSARDAIVENGYAVATMLNGTADDSWAACVGCAILSRSLERTGTKVPTYCEATCFQKYCWNGTLDHTAPPSYMPPFKGTQIKLKSNSARQAPVGLYMCAGVMLLSMVAFG